MMKRLDDVLGPRARGVAACLMFGALLAAWQRALDAVAGRTVYTLSAFWVAVIGGVILGWLLSGLVCRRFRHPEVLLKGAFLLVACWLVFQLALVAGIAGGWQRLLLDTTRTFGLLLQTLGKTAAFLLVVPSVLAGVALRVFWQMRREPAAPQQAAVPGVLQSVAFAVLGFAAAGLWVPAVGVETATRLAALWFASLASLAVLNGGGRRTGARLAAACVPFAAVAGLSAALLSGGGYSILSDGAFGRLVHRDSGFARGKPLFEHVTRRHTVTAYADPDYQFVFTLDGRPLLFGSRLHTARTLTGYVPLLVRPACAKAALIGPEAGVYVPFFARAGVADIAVAGTELAVVRLAVAADAFVTGDDACEKAAVRSGVELTASAGYDVIFLTPDPVWVRGAGAATSRAQFARCRNALSAGGIVALHLDARTLSVERFASIARDFAAAFPALQVWCTGANDWVLVGAAGAIKTPVDGMLELFERGAVFRDFVRAGGVALPEALACMLCDGKGLEPWLKEAGAESAVAASWRAPRAVFETARTTLQPVTLEGCRQWKASWVLPGETDVDVYVALLDKVGRTLGARVAAVTALAEMAKGRHEAGLGAARAAAKISPRDALLLQLAESVELEGRRRIKIGDLKGALKCYENLLSFSSGTARTHYGMGFCLRGNGDNESAYLHFARAVAAAPEQTDYRLDLAQAALSVGEFAEADRQFREVLKREPRHAEALFRYAKGLAMRERPVKDLPQAVKLAERACELTRWENREYAFGLADLYMDAGRVLEGMGLKRRLKEGVKPTAKVSP